MLAADWAAAPVLIPAAGAAAGLLARQLRDDVLLRVEQAIALLVVAANLVVSVVLAQHVLSADGGRLVVHLGDWRAPFGVTLVVDGLSAILLVLTAVLFAATVPFSIGTLDLRERLHYHPLVLFLLMGVNGAFLAGDLFNLYVFFEVLLMSSFVLLTLGGQHSQISGGLRYVVLNLVGSLVFLLTAGVVYGSVGTLNLAQLIDRLDRAPETVQVLAALLLFVVFAGKAGLFPLFFWLPVSYHTPHPAVTALFGGLLTKVGIYALFRVYTLLFPELLTRWQTALLLVAGLTMITGVLGAMAVPTIRRVLSFHVISQVGYMVMGLGLAASADPEVAAFALAAGVFYLAHHMIVKTALLMAGGVAELESGSGNLTRGRLRGLVSRRRVLALLFFLAAFSLAGIPPSSGFVAKLGLLQAAVRDERWIIAGVSLGVSLLTLMSMVRLWQAAFWGERVEGPEPVVQPLASPVSRWLTLTPIAALVAISLSVGLFGDQVYEWSRTAADQAIDRDGYRQDVDPGEDLGPLATGDEEAGGG